MKRHCPGHVSVAQKNIYLRSQNGWVLLNWLLVLHFFGKNKCPFFRHKGVPPTRDVLPNAVLGQSWFLPWKMPTFREGVVHTKIIIIQGIWNRISGHLLGSFRNGDGSKQIMDPWFGISEEVNVLKMFYTFVRIIGWFEIRVTYPTTVFCFTCVLRTSVRLYRHLHTTYHPPIGSSQHTDYLHTTRS